MHPTHTQWCGGDLDGQSSSGKGPKETEPLTQMLFGGDVTGWGWREWEGDGIRFLVMRHFRNLVQLQIQIFLRRTWTSVGAFNKKAFF
jgi:hypothetical protein